MAMNAVGVYGEASRSTLTDWAIVQSESFNLTSEGFTLSGGQCSNIPHKIVLTLFYAEQGKVSSQPFYQIVGARLSYEAVSWTLQCVGAETSPCGSTAAVQSFDLLTETRFVQVPPDWRKQLLTSRDIPSGFSSLRDRSMDPDACAVLPDSCWPNTFAPWNTLPRNSGQFYIRLAFAFGLGIIGLLIVLMLCPIRPGNRFH
ncbi:hypothetical protein Ciccas_010133 [Cichlidogyrus casuarinus]|uniref:Uncharacterized protein n=1 Tax=Cichlidogyrus casuarinus TaxID=1844966 RepID=A0ABD2PZK5_9PLAT